MLYNFENENLEMPIYAIDTNVLISMYGSQFYEKDWTLTTKGEKLYSRLNYLLSLVKNKTIGLVVPAGVIAELNFRTSRYNDNIIKFLKSGYFLRPNWKKNNLEEYRNSVDGIARIYAKNLDTKDIQLITKRKNLPKLNNVLVQSAFPYDEKMRKPINDAYIMAESAYLGLPLITRDYKDFLEKPRPHIISYKNQLQNLQKNAIPLSLGTAYNEIYNSVFSSDYKKLEEKQFNEFFR